MLAEWIAEDAYVGPRHRPTLAIKKGDVRRVLGVWDGKYSLSGRNNQGSYGWVSGDKIRIIDTEFLREKEMMI